MNINEYEIKLNHLYDLLLDKLKYKKDINETIDGDFIEIEEDHEEK